MNTLIKLMKNNLHLLGNRLPLIDLIFISALLLRKMRTWLSLMHRRLILSFTLYD